MTADALYLWSTSECGRLRRVLMFSVAYVSLCNAATFESLDLQLHFGMQVNM